MLITFGSSLLAPDLYFYQGALSRGRLQLFEVGSII